jgi:hypothetical protein
MDSNLRNTSQRTHFLATKLSASMSRDQIKAARDLYSAFLTRGIGVCTRDQEELDLGVMIVALASLLANCLDEYCALTEALRPSLNQNDAKKEYVM